MLDLLPKWSGSAVKDDASRRSLGETGETESDYLRGRGHWERNYRLQSYHCHVLYIYNIIIGFKP